MCVFLLSRDGPDQSSPQIGQFSGNTALESVYSTSNIILIKFHSDFSGAGFFVLSYHGKRSPCLGNTVVFRHSIYSFVPRTFNDLTITALLAFVAATAIDPSMLSTLL